MKNIYKIEMYDIEEETGIVFLDYETTNKKEAIKTAREEQNKLCYEDAKHTIFIVQKQIDIEEFEEVFETKIKE